MTTIAFERNFLNVIITDFDKVLTFLPPDKFGKMYDMAYMVYSKSNQVTTYSLNEIGIMALFYIQIFKEAYPKNPTPEQQERIDAIWAAMKVSQQ